MQHSSLHGEYATAVPVRNSAHVLYSLSLVDTAIHEYAAAQPTHRHMAEELSYEGKHHTQGYLMNGCISQGPQAPSR